jgi:hypothetical protein
VLIISSKTGQKRVLFDAVKDGENISPKWVLPEEEQELKESRRYVPTVVIFRHTYTTYSKVVEGSHISHLKQRHGGCDGCQVCCGGCATGTTKDDGGEWGETRSPIL